jgi:hypothetical protein
MPYKRLPQSSEAFSIPQILAVFRKMDFFNPQAISLIGPLVSEMAMLRQQSWFKDEHGTGVEPGRSRMAFMTTEWNLRYDAWIIGDGEPDRSVGEVFEWFAVEFYNEQGLVRIEAESKSAIPVADFEYRVVAEVIYVSEKTCIIDFGLRAIANWGNLCSACKEGDYVSGIIGIGFPAYAADAPDPLFKTLERRWRVNRISADLTPYTSEVCMPDGSRIPEGMRDGSRIQYQEVNSTQSLRTHSYILHCSEVIE